MASSKEIEREVETQRAHVESTLDALRQKMSVGQMVDEFGQYMGADDAKAAMRNVGRQIRDNPVALGLVGVGLAWLMFGGGSGGGRDWRDGYARDDEFGRGDERRGDWGRSGYGTGDIGAGYAEPGRTGERYGSDFGSPYGGEDRDRDRDGTVARAAKAVSGAVSDVGQTIGDTVSRVGGAVSGAVSGAGERARSAGESGRRRMHEMGEDMADYAPSRHGIAERGERMGDALAETIERQPLLAGAVAMAVGAAIGAALPSTRTEDRWLGEGRDELVGDARRAASDLGRQASDAARAGLHAAQEAAHDEGLTPDPKGKTLADRVESVVRTGVDEAKNSFAEGAEGDKSVGEKRRSDASRAV